MVEGENKQSHVPEGDRVFLEGLQSDIKTLMARTEHLIIVVETRRMLVDRFDERIAKVEALERSLGSTALKLASARVLTSWVPGAVAGAVAGAIVVWVFLQTTVVSAAH
jgi:hypothetical protein